MNPATGEVAGPAFEAQARQSNLKLRAILEDAGSGLSKVVTVTCVVADPNGFAALNELFLE